MEKEVKLHDNNTVSLDINKSYCGSTIRITKRYFENGEYVKDFCLSMWDDYGFDAWIDNIETLQTATQLSFVIPFDDPLYFCFLKFLRDDREFVIDSDDVSELNMKTFTIRLNDNDEIELVFENKMPNISACDKFNLFIKNIGFDLRSKIDCFNLDTKKRLYELFMDAKTAILEDYHQITIDEYMLIRKREKQKN